jgi:hypothetical protein
VAQPAVGGFGDYYILPTNVCAVSLLSTQLVKSINITNPLSGVIVVFTNASGEEVGVDSLYSETPYYSFLQYVYVVREVECPEDAAAWRQGINQVRFERREFDSLLGRFFFPITNGYWVYMVTNNTLRQQYVQRTITSPDFLFSTAHNGTSPYVINRVATTGDYFDSTNALLNLNGPGRMVTPVEFQMNKDAPLYINHPSFLPGGLTNQNLLSELSQQTLMIWSSFDGTTNAPVLYPNGTSLQNLENQILIQVGPAGPALPDGIVGVNYTTMFDRFTVVGGTPPYAWSFADYRGLPPGLTLNAGTGQITGVPTTQNTYDFTIRMTDAMGRFVDRDYSITVTP